MAYLFTRLMDLDDSKAHLIARRYLRTDCNHSAACSVPPGTISLRLLPNMVTSFLWCPIFHVFPCMAIKVLVTSYSSDTRWSRILFRINFLCALPFHTSDRHIDTYVSVASKLLDGGYWMVVDGGETCEFFYKMAHQLYF